MAESMQTIPDAPIDDLDDFAQTRGADDLFESEIQPVVVPPEAPREPRAFRTGVGRTAATTAGGSGGGGGGGKQVKLPPAATETSAGGSGEERTSPTTTTTTPQANRLLSGGVRKPKLTDEELAERMERVKLNDARLRERARKANEDESSFQVLEEQRRQLDSVRRLQDRKKNVEQEKNRRELDQEREKNRQRKLKAVQAREWDSEKKEEDYNPRGYNPRFRRGAYGGVAASPRRGNIETTPTPVATKPTTKPTEKPIDSGSQWPVLPGSKSKDGEAGETKIPLMSPGAGTWAEQVEAGISPATPTAAAEEWGVDPNAPTAAAEEW
ncbi:hypothetical protein K440DRAFT_630612 [Wilcoxina mikolae CBS 423.85]|nr:hypothetical protein K440DRAFT_630612 [Wilcoxina mikolae CBS 423.85]